MAKLILSGATSGSISLESPAVSGTTTLTLPTTSGTVITTGSTGQVINKASLPAGSVLQVVSANTTTQTSTSGTSYVDSTITGAITPTSATSKILIVVSVNGCEKTNASTQNALHIQLLRGAVSISEFAHYLLYTNSALANCGACSINYLDSPATTSATTYKVQFRNEAASGAVYVQSSSAMSTITLMEIAA